MVTSSSKAMGSLADLLLDFVGSTRVHDQNFDIAQGLLRNYTRLSAMSLRQMADACYVSAASFSRFCRFMGFGSFTEFKEAVDGTNYRLTDDYTRQFYADLMDDDAKALEGYRANVVEVLASSLSEADLAVVGHLVDALDAADRIVFFSHHFLWHIGRYFQGKMLPMGRYVELYQSYANQEGAAASLGPSDVAVICSLNGSFFSHYRELVNTVFETGAKVVVLTQNRYGLFINRADCVLMCGSSNENDVGKYAALMTIDYLVMSYMRHTQTKGQDNG